MKKLFIISISIIILSNFAKAQDTLRWYNNSNFNHDVKDSLNYNCEKAILYILSPYDPDGLCHCENGKPFSGVLYYYAGYEYIYGWLGTKEYLHFKKGRLIYDEIYRDGKISEKIFYQGLLLNILFAEINPRKSIYFNDSGEIELKLKYYFVNGVKKEKLYENKKLTIKRNNKVRFNNYEYFKNESDYRDKYYKIKTGYEDGKSIGTTHTLKYKYRILNLFKKKKKRVKFKEPDDSHRWKIDYLDKHYIIKTNHEQGKSLGTNYQLKYKYRFLNLFKKKKKRLRLEYDSLYEFHRLDSNYKNKHYNLTTIHEQGKSLGTDYKLKYKYRIMNLFKKKKKRLRLEFNKPSEFYHAAYYYDHYNFKSLYENEKLIETKFELKFRYRLLNLFKKGKKRMRLDFSIYPYY